MAWFRKAEQSHHPTSMPLKLSSVHHATLREASESVDQEVVRAITNLAMAIIAYEEIFARLSLVESFQNTITGVAVMALSYLMTDDSATFIWSSKNCQDKLSKITEAMRNVCEIAKAPASRYPITSRFFRSSYWAIKQQLKIVNKGSPFRAQNISEDDLKRILECFQTRRQRKGTSRLLQGAPEVPEPLEQPTGSLSLPESGGPNCLGLGSAGPIGNVQVNESNEPKQTSFIPSPSTNDIALFNNADALTFSGNTTINAIASHRTMTAHTIYNINFIL
ncbi:hypothetical protein CPB83DRAFT_890757 [Crepidotus variabilis]|uniref:Uncharacterized protein n=1 Tax=Crepidotus variabilis TaxID=179855 RepID=A0A9P6JTM7_9AGAR|nr:hypothetical protein CPB83DRAFT_890757 [Crepidotus variabilis]